MSTNTRAVLLPLLACIALASAQAQVPATADAAGAATSRDAERHRISQERQAVQARQAEEEAACYGRFAVNDCLSEARARHRGVLADLRRQELSLNDAERREKGAAQQRLVDQRMRGEQQGHPGTAGGQPRLARPPAGADPADRAAARERDAVLRAEQQQRHIAGQQREQASRAERAAEVPVQRQRYAEKLRAAEDRRVQNARNRQERQKDGRVVQPLPVPPP